MKRERERERERVNLNFVFVQDSGVVAYAWLAKLLMYDENSIQPPVRILKFWCLEKVQRASKLHHYIACNRSPGGGV